jgi:hypothetical protein
MAEVLSGKFNAIMTMEDTAGTFKTPVASDNNFPLGVEDISYDGRMSEGFRDANGKFSNPRQFANGWLATFKANSYLMEPVDANKTDGAVEIAPILVLSGFRQVDGTTNKELVWDGEGSCSTASMRALNKACGVNADGVGTDLRGIRLSTTIMAETSGSAFMVTADGMAGVDGDIDTTKTVITDVYSNDADKRNIEMFVGSLTLNGVATPVEGLTIAMNAENQEQKTSESGKKGIDYIYGADYKPTVSITAPIGTATTSWWAAVVAGRVVDTMVYSGTYFDISCTDLVINSIARSADGKVKLTQELSPKTITITPK